MIRVGVWMLATLPVLGVGTVPVGVSPAAAAPAAAPAPAASQPRAARGAAIGRLGGPTRYDTAAAAAIRPRDGHPITAVTVVSGLDPMRAAASSGPNDAVFYVPPRGAVPQSVRTAIASIPGVPVRASGTKAALPDAQVRAAIGKRPFTRIARGTVSAHRDHDVRKNMPEYSEMYTGGFVTQRSLPAAVAGLQTGASLIPDGPADPAPETYDVSFRRYTRPQDLVGGLTTLTAWQRAWLAGYLGPKLDEGTVRNVPADVYGLSARAALADFPTGSTTVFLAEGQSGVDAAPVRARYDGPVLLVPRCGALPKATRNALARLRPERVVAIGDRTSVCDATLRAATAATSPLPQRRAVDLAGGFAVLTTKKVVKVDAPQVTLPMPEPITALSGPVSGKQGLWLESNQPAMMYALGASGRVWAWPAGRPQARTAVTAWGRNVARLAPGTGVPCAVLRSGITSCLWTSSPTSKAVTIPGAPAAATFAVDGPALAITDRTGRPYLWTRYRGKLSVLRPKGLPARVKALELADTTHAYSLTADGTVRVHWFGGQPGEVVARGVRILYPGGGGARSAASVRGQCVSSDLTRATVRRYDPSNHLLLTTDGRVWKSLDTTDPVRGLGG